MRKTMKQQIKNVRLLNLREKSKWITTDVTVEDGIILSLEKDYPADKVFDGEGLVLSPGFVDIHMHEEDFSQTGDNTYDIAECMLKMGVTTAMGGNCGSEKTDFHTFLDTVDKNGSPINYCLGAGYNSIRKEVGVLENEKPTKEQMLEIQKILKEQVEDGAFGITFGIEYNPYLTVDEILEALRPFYGRKDLFVAAHSRYDGYMANEGIKEMAEIARRSQIPFQISHLSSCCAYGKMEGCLKTIEENLNQGVDLLVDTYPYNAFSTQIGTSVFEGDFLKKWNASYEDIQLTEEPYSDLELDDDSFQEIRKNHPDMLVIAKVMNEYEIKKSLKKPYVMIASDGLYKEGNGHPRGAGTFPRVLGPYVREGVLTLEEALYKATLQPAKRLGLDKEIGKIEPGYRADMVLFDPEEIEDCASFEDGQKPPLGIKQVWINGELALEDNKIINDRLGRSRRRGK